MPKQWQPQPQSPSVSKDTDGKPSEVLGGRISPREVVFRECLRFLVAAGKPEKAARSALGKWRRDHGDGAVIDAVSAAQEKAVSDPVPWIEGALRARSKPSPRPSYGLGAI